MKKFIGFLFALAILATTGFAETLFIENQTLHPSKELKTKLAIQWAQSAKEVQEQNLVIASGEKLNPKSVQVLNRSGGKITLSVPKQAQYFRILIWTKEQTVPDLLTNWVDVVPNKNYILEEDHLVPSPLMGGMGC